MGLFKDMSSLMKQANEMPRPSMRDAVKQANEAMQVYGDTSRLMQIGVRGRAEIHSVTDTGATINDNPIVEMSMTVTMDGGGTYDCIVKQPIQRLQVSMIRAGANLPVLVDPQDRERLVIDPNAPAEMANQMAATAAAQAQAAQGQVPQQDASARLERLAGLKAQGLISESEYEAQRARILADL